jgi:hypothetical protein
VPASLILLLTIIGVATVLRARPVVVLGLYVSSAMLVPGSLAVPLTGTSYLTIQHVLVVAGLARLVLSRYDGTLPASALRATRVHLALGVFLLVSLVVGVLIAVDAGEVTPSVGRLVDLLDQLGYFVVCLALIRHIADLRLVLAAAAVGVVLAGAGGIVEHITGDSWGHFLFSKIPAQQLSTAAFPLGNRDGTLRVRVGGEFALQYAWMVAMLLPVLAGAALVCTRRVARGFGLALVGGTVAMLAVYWSFARTALAAGVLALAAFALLSRQRLLVVAAGLGMVGAAALYLTVPTVARHLDASADTGSIDVRVFRLAPFMDTVSYHPLRGLGLGGLLKGGFRVSDNAFLLSYVELGAIGVVMLVLVLAVAVAESLRPLWSQGIQERVLGAAAAVGVLAYVASAMTYDAFSLIQGTHVLWFLVAFSIVLGERALEPRRLLPVRAAWVRASVAGAIGLAVAGGVYALAPQHTAERLILTSLPQVIDTRPGDALVDGARAIKTACGTAFAIALPDVDLDCTDLSSAPGLARLRVQAPTIDVVREAVATYGEAFRTTANLPGARLLSEGPARSGKSSWVRTAPVWLPVGLAGLALLLPRRRRDDVQ